MDTPIRWGMVGGGQGAFIGEIHRLAARIDGRYQLQAAALSANPERARQSGLALGLPSARCYTDFSQMALAEAARPDGIEVVSIVTPNHLHYPVAKAFLEAGIHVICDKPLALSVAEGQSLLTLSQQQQRMLAVTYNYSANAMVQLARLLVRQGKLGRIRLVQVEYCQDWLSQPIEQQGHKQASWRTDPAQAGPAGCLGDIGSHAFHLARFVSGLQLEAVSAELHHFVTGRRLEDNVQASLRFVGGARGSLWASQVATGKHNALSLRLFGEKGSLEWQQEQPEQLAFCQQGEPWQLLKRGGPGFATELEHLSRLPVGHPEGYLEAFANLYQEVGNSLRGLPATFPSVRDALQDLYFIEACLASHQQRGAWISPPSQAVSST